MVVMAGVAVTQPNIAGKSDGNRLQVVQEEFLNIVGNLTSSVKDMEELMMMLHTQHGRQMGRLLMEGVMLGATQKDSWALLSEFWTQLHGRLSPEFQDRVKDYTDFFGSFDIRTLPYFLEQMFKKDDQGKSMADIPMGQLVDMVQPAASKYGVDLRAFMDSVMGKGDNNARDLIFAALDNLNVTSLFQLFAPPAGKDVPSSNAVRTTEPEPSDSKPRAGEKLKKVRGDETLRLFRPLVASLLRENKIDLDADAVLQVLSPLLNGDLMSQIAPLLSGLGSQAGDGIGPILLNLLGGEKGMGTQAKQAGLLGVMGTLLARGNNKNMDLEGMLTMASMLMNMNEKQGEKKARSAKTKEPDMGGLASLAGKLLENNDVSNLIKEASSFLASTQQKNVPSRKSKESETARPGEQKLRKTGDKPEKLTDLLEPFLQAMAEDKQGSRKIKDLVLFGKTFLARNADIGGFVQQISGLLSLYEMDPEKKKRVQDLQRLLANNDLSNVNWARVFEGLQNEETRSSLIQTMTPTLSEFVLQLGSKKVQQNLYMMAEVKVQTLLAAYGLKGITFKNFPERLAPLVHQMTAAWRLPLNPATQLEPLRDYSQRLLEWISEGLVDLSSLPSRTVS